MAVISPSCWLKLAPYAGDRRRHRAHRFVALKAELLAGAGLCRQLRMPAAAEAGISAKAAAIEGRQYSAVQWLAACWHEKPASPGIAWHESLSRENNVYQRRRGAAKYVLLNGRRCAGSAGLSSASARQPRRYLCRKANR